MDLGLPISDIYHQVKASYSQHHEICTFKIEAPERNQIAQFKLISVHLDWKL